MTASERQHELGRAWAARLRPAQGSRDAWARFDAEEERAEIDRETREGGR